MLYIQYIAPPPPPALLINLSQIFAVRIYPTDTTHMIAAMCAAIFVRFSFINNVRCATFCRPDQQTDGKTDGKMDRQTGRQTDGQTDRRADEETEQSRQHVHRKKHVDLAS